MDTFSNGETYSLTNFDYEDTIQGTFYGRSAQSNQEILDLAVECTNKFIDSLATALAMKTPQPSGRFLTFESLEGLIPEYFVSQNEQVPGTISPAATNAEYVFYYIHLDNYAYPCSAILRIHNADTGENTYFKCVPATSKMLDEVMTGQYDEFNTIPLYRVQTDPVSNTPAIAVFVQGNITGVPVASVPYPDIYADLTFRYIAKQLPIDLSQSNPNELLLSSRYDDYVINLMIEAYERLKK